MWLSLHILQPELFARIFRLFRFSSQTGLKERLDPVEAIAAEDALITRPALDVVVRHLPDGGAIFLEHLISGDTLGEAACVAFEANPSFDLPANIAGMIEAGVFAAIRHGDQR